MFIVLFESGVNPLECNSQTISVVGSLRYADKIKISLKSLSLYLVSCGVRDKIKE
jgi:hypothetical protein